MVQRDGPQNHITVSSNLTLPSTKEVEQLKIMIHDLEQKVNQIYTVPSDINQHIPVIVQLAQECNHITEMGVRTVVSTWGWLAGAPKDGLISYDLYNPKYWLGENNDPIKDVSDTAEAYDIKFKFVEADVCEIEIEETDLLFIDTWHVYDQLKEELRIHSNKARKYICFHDTTSFAHQFYQTQLQ